MDRVVFNAPYERTPATVPLMSALESGDWAVVASVINEHWAELWYAVDPADLRTLLMTIPQEYVELMPRARLLMDVAGLPDALPRPAESGGRADQVELAVQRVADLRLNGRPAEALKIIARVNDQIARRRGRLLDTSEGKVAVWDVQVGIAALLVGDLAGAKGHLLAATEPHRPTRFPFARREAAAKIALTLAVSGKPEAAREWADRARGLPRTASWVEPMIDDSLWLCDYILAIDMLDLETAESLRLERPSPLDHLEFWGVALQAHVRHLALTDRHERAESLCDAISGRGLPLPDSDGWLVTMLADARLHALRHGERAISSSTAEAVLAVRLSAFLAGQFDVAAAPAPTVMNDQTAVRARLALNLLRVQARHGAEASERTLEALVRAVSEVFESGLLSTFRYISRDTVTALAGTPEGSRLAELLELHRLPTLQVEAVTSEPLTRAEITVLSHLAEGLSRQEIADRLFLSLSTVKTHLRTAYRKLGATTRAEAVAALGQLDATGG